MRTQTNKKFRLLMLSMPRRSGILPGWWVVVLKIKQNRSTGIKILFVASACCLDERRACPTQRGWPL